MGRLARIMFWCLLVLFSASAVGCNTLEGAGQDVEQTGEAVQEAAD